MKITLFELKKIIRNEINAVLLKEGLQSKVIDISSENDEGSLSAVVHYDINRIKNWALMEKLDDDLQQTLSELPTPVSILKNIWIEPEARGKGIGRELMDKYFEEADMANSFVLIADELQTQTEGFNLVKWYGGYDFEVVGHSGSDPVMVYIP